MPIAGAANRGRSLAINATALVRDTIAIAPGTQFITPELVTGITVGVKIEFYFRQSAGSNSLQVTPQYLFNQLVANTPNWRNIVNPYLIPVGSIVSTNMFMQPARRYRALLDAPAAPATAVTVDYFIAAWPL